MQVRRRAKRTAGRDGRRRTDPFHFWENSEARGHKRTAVAEQKEHKRQAREWRNLAKMLSAASLAVRIEARDTEIGYTAPRCSACDKAWQGGSTWLLCSCAQHALCPEHAKVALQREVMEEHLLECPDLQPRV